MNRILIFSILLFILFACNSTPTEKQLDQYKAEIYQVEKDFAEMAAEEGIEKAFLAFADKKAVLLRGQKLIKGKTEIRDYFKEQAKQYQFVKLEWKPDFVDVSESGDLAYSYGGFTSAIKTKDGELREGQGVFHTVWKRQADGNWKFVWD